MKVMDVTWVTHKTSHKKIREDKSPPCYSAATFITPEYIKLETFYYIYLYTAIYVYIISCIYIYNYL